VVVSIAAPQMYIAKDRAKTIFLLNEDIVTVREGGLSV
jgi:hypothetical protein